MPNLYVIAAPSGTGKTTLVKSLVDNMPNLTVSISHTTRTKRPGEMHGVNYYFIDQTEFQAMLDRNEFLEYATVFENNYGTSKTWVENTLKANTDVILEIDWQGSQQIKKLFPNCISIFILPPSLKALAERLKHRNQDKPEIIKKRLADVKQTIYHVNEFDFIVVNDDFETALHDLKTIIQAQRLRCNIQIPKLASLIADLQRIN